MRTHAYLTSTRTFSILPVNLFPCCGYAELTLVPSSTPTSAASSAEKMLALVRSTRPEATFLPSLVTTVSGRYESGAFDVRSPEPRPTALVPCIRELSTQRAPTLNVEGDGWWRRPERMTSGRKRTGRPRHSQKPLLILGVARSVVHFDESPRVEG